MNQQSSYIRLTAIITHSALLLAGIICGVLVLAKPAAATLHRSSDRLTIEERSHIKDDMIVTAGEFNIDGSVEGDVLALTKDFRLNGTIAGAALIAAEHSNIDGDIGHSLGVFSRRASIGATVRGSGYIFAQKVEIGEEALFFRDLTIFTDSLFMGGEISGKLRCFVGSELIISGSISGDLEIDTDATVVVRETARIGGDIIIHGPALVEVETGAIIKGEIIRLKDESIDTGSFSFRDIILFIYLIFAFFVLALLALLVSGSHYQRASLAIRKDLLRSFAFGIVILIVGFFVSMALSITLIGIIAGAVLFGAIALIVLLLGPIYAASGIGALIISPQKTPTLLLGAARTFVGLLIIFAISEIPFVGCLFFILTGITGLGAFIIASRSGSSSPKLELQNPPPASGEPNPPENNS